MWFDDDMLTRSKARHARIEEPRVLLAGGDHPVSILSAAGYALLPHLTFLGAAMLRRTCREGRYEVAKHGRLQGWAAAGLVKTVAGKYRERGS